jgi:hypothetical protein
MLLSPDRYTTHTLNPKRKQEREREREREQERERERNREREQVTGPHVKRKQWLRARGGACSLPEVGGACDLLVVRESLLRSSADTADMLLSPDRYTTYIVHPNAT